MTTQSLGHLRPAHSLPLMVDGSRRRNVGRGWGEGVSANDNITDDHRSVIGRQVGINLLCQLRSHMEWSLARKAQRMGRRLDGGGEKRRCGLRVRGRARRDASVVLSQCAPAEFASHALRTGNAKVRGGKVVMAPSLLAATHRHWNHHLNEIARADQGTRLFGAPLHAAVTPEPLGGEGVLYDG